MNARTPTLALLAALLAMPVAAQPAANANPHAFKKETLTPECQKLRDEYIKAQTGNKAAHGDGKDDGQRAKGGHPEQKAMRKEFETRCGALPPEMTPKTKDDVVAPVAPAAPAAAPAFDACKAVDKEKDFVEKGKLAEQCEKQKRAAKQATAAPVAPAASTTIDACKAVDKEKDFVEKGKLAEQCEKQKRAAKQAADAAPVLGGATAAASVPAPLPKKAGPATGSSGRYDDKRCAQLHQSMKDALARKAACGTDKACKQTAQSGYEQVRTAYQSGCGEVPADAKPAKKG